MTNQVGIINNTAIIAQAGEQLAREITFNTGIPLTCWSPTELLIIGIGRGILHAMAAPEHAAAAIHQTEQPGIVSIAQRVAQLRAWADAHPISGSSDPGPAAKP